MSDLPITHMTLYKHGVGFFERRAQFSGEQMEMTFRVGDMNDILKSLTVVDYGGGQVLGIDYATPQSREELLQGCSIRLDDARSMRDLLSGLRGREVSLSLTTNETLRGVLVGLDEPSERQPIGATLVSLLLSATTQVYGVPLERVQSVEIHDERGAADLRFFLETALGQENYRRVTIRLSEGAHDLSVSYIAPAPTWRVSYRLVVESEREGRAPRALLLGWGIFDNQLEEDLQAISLSLVAGMPISFVYDLYTPFTPERPKVEEEARVAAAPVTFEAAPQALGAGFSMGALNDGMMARAMAPAPAAPPAFKRQVSLEEMAGSQAAAAKGEALGELFQYVIHTPVTVGRGRSAMAPVVSNYLTYRKDLLYNEAKMPGHPVATLRLNNETGLTLERGPVTVLEDGEYVGEAVLPFTVAGGELVVPYAVELGIKVRPDISDTQEMHALRIKGIYLHIEDWNIRTTTYLLTNTTGETQKVLVEQPRRLKYDLFDSPQPLEQTDQHYRFQATLAPHAETRLQIKERQLQRRHVELQRQTLQQLQSYWQRGMLDQRSYDQAAKLLTLYETMAEYENQLTGIAAEREKIYTSQKQIQGNMAALGQTGKEGSLRAQYVDALGASEAQLKELATREASLKTQIAQVQSEINARSKEIG